MWRLSTLAVYLIAAKTIRSGVIILAKMVASTRTAATTLTYQKVAHLLTVQVMADLDSLLRFDVGLGMTRVAWLTAASVKTAIGKLTFLRAMDAHMLLLPKADDLAVMVAIVQVSNEEQGNISGCDDVITAGERALMFKRSPGWLPVLDVWAAGDNPIKVTLHQYVESALVVHGGFDSTANGGLGESTDYRSRHLHDPADSDVAV